MSEEAKLRDSRFSTPELAAEPVDQEGGSRAELLAELARLDEEILKLRDLLIGKDAELGNAKGRVAQLEDRTKPLASAKQRLEAQVPLFGKLVRGLLRLFRGQS
jgi:hypothetical protein